MANAVGNLKVAKAILANLQIVLAKPSINWFLGSYLRKFKVIEVGGNLIIHSHLPPLNSKAYSRFVKEHILAKTAGPSHAQIGITNACPQNCEYCYNKNRSGKVMDTETLKKTIRDLKSIGVFWIGLTGGEPLLNKNIVEIIESAGDDCAVKLFTTGSTLTKQLAADLKAAGLFSVSVSLDHWQEAEHDRVRRYPGAYRIALQAIEIFKNLGGIHVGVSAVLAKEMLKPDLVEEYLAFLQGLGIHEAWLSETKPSVAAYWHPELVITPEERAMLIDFQDRYNRDGKMTINYLGHFEDAQHFGCAAGHKMVYIDAFGEVSPCVFIPMTFGNVKENSISDIYPAMRKRFPTENSCFINKNYPRFQHFSTEQIPIAKEDAVRLMQEVEFGPLAKFFRLYYS